MSSKKFLVVFVICILIIASSIMSLNYFIDPFGVFGDKYFNWASFNITNNPRTAKITYLDNNYKKYNAYIIGSSGASAFPVEDLNKYTEKKYYNLFYYGVDMFDSLNTAEYVINKYNVKEIFLPISFGGAFNYKSENDNLNYSMHSNVEKTSPVTFWSRYLFADPRYGIEKITSYFEDSYFQKSFDVFVENNGLYDKSIRDVEYIGEPELYKTAFPEFDETVDNTKKLWSLEESMKAVEKIKKMCDENGIKLTVVAYPIYQEVLKSYKPKDIDNFFEQLARITDYWDFTLSSISYESRYFYDPDHFRNTVGRMIISKIHGDNNVYLPDDFGTYVSKGESRTYQSIIKKIKFNVNDYSKNVPILTFHHISNIKNNKDIVSEKKFFRVMKYLKEHNYTTILYDDLKQYVTQGKALPKKPIMITFDDGYMSNYEIAYPILKKNKQKATIFIIGTSLGKNTYRSTTIPIIPHFTLKQAEKMKKSGTIDFGSHSYDLHQYEKFEKKSDMVFQNMLKKNDETEKDYIIRIREDCEKFKKVYSKINGRKIEILSYPLGKFDEKLNVLLAEEGIKCTFTVKSGNNSIMKGLPQTLFNLRRNNVAEATDIKELLNNLK